MKWFILGLMGYMLYKVSGPLISLFKMKRSIKEKQRKSDIRTKVQKMDIQDAEFEDKSDE
jgi:hypothetical protein